MNEPANPATVAWTPGAAASVPLSLEELLLAQDAHWQRGERALVEALLAQHPSLGAQAEAVLELVFNEVLLRQELGEQPALAEYVQRFPEHAAALRIQWELDRLLASRRSRQRASVVVPRQQPPASCIGRYEIQSVLGKGGMGIAYLAWDPNLKRQVAVKMLRGTDSTEQDEARFHGEAEAIARVKHANIVQVFDVGTHDGQPFFAMEYCAGGSLAQRLSGQPMPGREAAIVVEQIARAVAAAHEQHIIHRDLKPANVLIVEQPPPKEEGSKSTLPDGFTGKASVHKERAADSATVARSGSAGKRLPPPAHYKVTDFGLAKQIDAADDGQTRTGAVLGTPSYMAPEQAFGATKQLTPLVDVYALGAVLYECLTGRPPFRGATFADTLDQVRYREVVPVRQLQPGVPADLETIALKCLQKEPNKRYASAEALADDLQRYLEGRPILARPLGPLARGWRWCRRNPVVASLLAVVFLVLTSGVCSTTVLWLEAESQGAEATRQAKLVEAESALVKEKSREVDRQAELVKKENGKVKASNAKLLDSLLDFDNQYNSFLIDISQGGLMQEPHMTELRKKLLQRARPAYEKLVAHLHTIPEFQIKLGNTIAHMAHIEDSIGDSEKSLELLRQAIAVFDGIKGKERTLQEATYRKLRAQVYAARSLQHLGRDAEAEQLYVKAHQGLVALVKVQPDPSYIDSANKCMLDLSNMHKSKGEYAQAEQYLRQALATEDELETRLGTKRPYQRGSLLFALGHLLGHKDASAASRELRAAQELLSWCVANDRDVSDARLALGKTLGALGVTLADRVEAEQAFLACHQLWDELVRDFPALPSHRRDRAANAHNLGGALHTWGRIPDADAWMQKALADREYLKRTYPKVPEYQLELAASYRQLAAHAHRQQQRELVISNNGKAMELLQELLRRHPNNQGAKDLLAHAASGRAVVLLQQNKNAESIPDWTLALEHHQGPRAPIYLSHRALALARIGDWKAARLDIDAAVKMKTLGDQTLYAVARACSRCVALLESDAAVSAADRVQQQYAFVRRALAALQGMQKGGFLSSAQRQQELREHADFQALRRLPEFQKLLTP